MTPKTVPKMVLKTDWAIDDLKEGPDDNVKDGLSNDSRSGSKGDSNTNFGYVLTAPIVT